MQKIAFLVSRFFKFKPNISQIDQSGMFYSPNFDEMKFLMNINYFSFQYSKWNDKHI